MGNRRQRSLISNAAGCRQPTCLAYTPDKGNTIGHHKIHLSVPNQKDYVVTARDGYYYGQ